VFRWAVALKSDPSQGSTLTWNTVVGTTLSDSKANLLQKCRISIYRSLIYDFLNKILKSWKWPHILIAESIKKKFIPSLKADDDTWLLYPYALSLEAMQHFRVLHQSLVQSRAKTRGTIRIIFKYYADSRVLHNLIWCFSNWSILATICTRNQWLYQYALTIFILCFCYFERVSLLF